MFKSIQTTPPFLYLVNSGTPIVGTCVQLCLYNLQKEVTANRMGCSDSAKQEPKVTMTGDKHQLEGQSAIPNWSGAMGLRPASLWGDEVNLDGGANHLWSVLDLSNALVNEYKQIFTASTGWTGVCRLLNTYCRSHTTIQEFGIDPWNISVLCNFKGLQIISKV